MGKLGAPTELTAARNVGDKVEWRLDQIGIESNLVEGVIVAGSVRRMKKIVSDVDVMVMVSPDVSDLTVLGQFIPEWHWTPKGGVANVDDVRVELYLCPPGMGGPMLQYLTGPGELNVYLRAKAIRRGLMLSQYGLRTVGGSVIHEFPPDPYAGEREVFDALQVPWMEPHERDAWRDVVRSAAR